MGYQYEPFSLRLTLTFSDNSTYVISPKVGDNNKLSMFKLNEEMSKDISNPIGVISANEINIQLLNNDGIFTLTNSASPLYGKLGRNVKIEVETTNNQVNYVNIGTFYTTKWNNETDMRGRVYAKINAVDRLQSILNLPAPPIEVLSNITLKEYAEQVFDALGLSGRYTIDSTLNQIIDLSLVDGNTVSDILNNITTTGFCFIYVDRDGQIVVFDRRKVESTLYSLSGSDSIVGLKVGPTYSNSYSIVRVNYGKVAVSDSEQFLSLKALTAPVGSTRFENIKLSKTNMVDIDYIRVTSVLGQIVINEITATQDTISFTVVNSGVEVQIDVKVYGRAVEVVDTFVERIDTNAVAEIGERVLEVDSKLIQNVGFATDLADTLFDTILKPVPYIQCVLKNVSLEVKVGDIVNIVSTKFDINEIVKIHSVNASYDVGGLFISITGYIQ